MGTRSIKAPLSPSEERTLRRVAIGRVEEDELPAGLLTRLHRLGLLDEAHHLTQAGRQRYEVLSNVQSAGADAFARRR